ncbi:PKD domain-containing protein [Elizabethkingia argentiflava]|uniref:PKD domain-containing protein n=1 Tax=Elizabethkingia argenteiflava TaxID=2681556 RepID=A0A845PQA8_9FLAO|nr:PKD domain-containing protein [Elizabethkingia argenteiflava]NAW50014.1 PKD domain-containing protein [Elizabethkingia argenteiflava]
MEKNKEEYKKKNTVKVIFIVVSILIAIVLIGIWLQKNFFHTVADIDAKVSPTTLSIGDTLFYADKSAFAAIKEWNFGDGNISVNDSGYYFYKKPGYYQVMLTLNGKYKKVFSIQVLDKPKANIKDSITSIEAPAQAMQFENVIFRAKSKNAKLFSWKFGESGSIDSKEQMVIYAYQKPGDYVVSLYTDETEYPITQKIKILPSFKLINDSISIDNIYQKIDDDFKYHLQQIANGSSFNQHYNYLLNKYLCKNENAPIKVNTSKINTFYYYCAGLQFDKNNIIHSVKVSFDGEMNCVTKVDIIQGK